MQRKFHAENAKEQRSLRPPPRCERRVQQLHKDAKNAATQFLHLWQQYNLQICGHWVLFKASKIAAIAAPL